MNYRATLSKFIRSSSNQVPSSGIHVGGRQAVRIDAPEMRKDLIEMEEVILEIATPKGIFSATFEKIAKIADVIAAAVAELGLDGGDQLELVYNGEVLSPHERPLVSFGLAGFVQLELVATGSGV